MLVRFGNFTPILVHSIIGVGLTERVQIKIMQLIQHVALTFLYIIEKLMNNDTVRMR